MSGCVIVFLVGLAASTVEASSSSSSSNGTSHGDEHLGIHLVAWNWEEVGLFITITIFIVLSGLAKIGFHHAHFLSSRVPESCLLVVVGLIMGAIVYLAAGPHCEDSATAKCIHGTIEFPNFSPELFFFFLLPPIILEASYSLYDRVFFDNLATILVMAVLGTALNFVIIGLLLYVVFQIGAMGKIRTPFVDPSPVDTLTPLENNYDLSLMQVMLFASLISAVDPVAVLAIFQEVGVNPDLYYLVFGESLLNDGVAVVFYKMMNTFATMEHNHVDITVGQYFLGLLSFFTVAFGGLAIGIVIGFITALITKTTTEVRVMEPLALLGMGYLAYMTAELFHWSGIISLIGCGLIQAHYSFKNISKKSYTTVKYFIRMASSTCDIIIFLFLGIAICKGPHYWHTGFIVWTICFCLIARFLCVYGLTWVANRKRVKKINLQEQFIMAYGGLRGAVGFSLVEMINADDVPPRQMFVTTTLAVVMFTIFFQGGTIKFLVNLLDIDKKKDEQRLITDEVNETVIEHIMSGIDVISGKRGKQYLVTLFEHYDEQYFKKWFCIQNAESDLTRLFEKLALSDHLVNLYGPTIVHEEGKGGSLLRPVHSSDLLDDTTEGTVSTSTSLRSSMRKIKRPIWPDDRPDEDRSPPPPLPPRSRTHSVLGHFRPSVVAASFRNRGQSDATRVTLDVPVNDTRTRRPSREDLDLVRHAFRQSIRRPRLSRDIVKDTSDQALYAQMKQRHAKARRISQLVLKHQHTSDDLYAYQNHDSDQESIERKSNLHKSYKHGNGMRHRMMSADAADEDPDNGESEVILDRDQLRRIPQIQRPGVQAVIQRHNQRVRSMSVSSAEHEVSPLYDTLRKTSPASHHRAFHQGEYANMEETENGDTRVTMANNSSSTPATTTTTTAPGVGKKPKAASGKRKLTPHPLNPAQDMKILGSNSSQIESKLSILDEDEEKSREQSETPPPPLPPRES